MKFYQWPSPQGNVGDDLNAWLWPRLFGSDFFDGVPDILLIGIGSVLDNRHLKAPHRIVFGAGLRGESGAPDISAPGWTVEFVRGPRSAGVLGLGPDQWISDPAILAPLADRALQARCDPKPLSKRPSIVGFVPYFKTPIGLAAGIAAAADLKLIPATLAPEQFMSNLLQCDAVLCEAMHGAILADAFGIPWMGCRIAGYRREGPTHYFKWADWMQTLDLAPRFLTLPSINRPLGASLLGDMAILAMVRVASGRIRSALADGPWSLSDRDLLATRQAAILQRIDSLRERLTKALA